MTPIIQTLLPGGTEFGWGYWNRWLGCERKAWFQENDKRVSGLSFTFGTDVGTVMHVMQEKYLMEGDDGNKMDTGAWLWTDNGAEPPKTYMERVVKEANRCFQAYRRHHPPGELGEVEEVETTHRVKNFLDLGIPFDIKPDAVVVLNEARAAKMGVPPGRYIVDHKTLGNAGPDDYMYFNRDLRFKAYMLAWNAWNAPVNGLLVNVTYRAKSIEFARFLIPLTDEEDEAVVRGTLERARDTRDQHIDAMGACRTNHCLNRFGKWCPYYEKCDRR